MSDVKQQKTRLWSSYSFWIMVVAFSPIWVTRLMTFEVPHFITISASERYMAQAMAQMMREATPRYYFTCDEYPTQAAICVERDHFYIGGVRHKGLLRSVSGCSFYLGKDGTVRILDTGDCTINGEHVTQH